MFNAIVVLVCCLSQVESKNVPYITGGQQGDANNYKHLVRIIADGNMCGGSLIAKNAVLTAAHCALNPCPDAYDIRQGKTIQAEMDSAPQLTAVSVHTHKGFNAQTIGDDISVIRIDPNHNMDTFLTVDTSGVGEGTHVHIAGWGKEYAEGNVSPHLKTLNLTVMSNSFCHQSYAIFNPETHMCADSRTLDDSVCMGDSGSPLVSRKSTVVGIASYTHEKCWGADSGFTRISAYSQWIKKIVDSKSPTTESTSGRCNSGESQPNMPQYDSNAIQEIKKWLERYFSQFGY